MVSLIPEPIFHIGSFSITNTIIDTLFVDLVPLALIIFTSRNLKMIPSLFQNSVESIIKTFYELTEDIAGERTRKIFPFFMSFFIFILVANWSEFIPGFSSFGPRHEGHIVPIFRSPTTDFNATLAFALFSAVTTPIFSIQIFQIKQLIRTYFSL